jgi:hypothetical protein
MLGEVSACRIVVAIETKNQCIAARCYGSLLPWRSLLDARHPRHGHIVHSFVSLDLPTARPRTIGLAAVQTHRISNHLNLRSNMLLVREKFRSDARESSRKDKHSVSSD